MRFCAQPLQRISTNRHHTAILATCCAEPVLPIYAGYDEVDEEAFAAARETTEFLLKIED
jgi:hypothetical protein